MNLPGHLTAIALVTLTLAPSSPANACTCAERPSVAEALDAADIVIQGSVRELRIVKHWQPWAPGQFSDHGVQAGPLRVLVGGGIVFPDQGLKYAKALYARLDVDAIWKGGDRRSVWIQTSASETSCGVNFQIGSSYLVYAYWSKEAEIYATGLCTRTKRLGTPEARQDFDMLPAASNALARAYRDSIADVLHQGRSTVVDGDVPQDTRPFAPSPPDP